MSMPFFNTATNSKINTADEQGQWLSDFDNDSDSVASYQTAFEEFDLDENTDPSYNEEIEWSRLIMKFGSRPAFQAIDTSPMEAYEVKLTEHYAAPIVGHQKKIENFSEARLTLTNINSFLYQLRIEGYPDQVYFAIQACTAVISDHSKYSKIVWVILKLEGPELLPKVAALRKAFQYILPENGFVDDKALHVSAACVRLDRNSQRESLIEKVTTIANYLNEANQVAPMTGYLDAVHINGSDFISISSRNPDDSVNNIVYTIRELLEGEYGFSLRRRSKPHMTLYYGRNYDMCLPDFNEGIAEVLGISSEFGPVRVTEIQVTQRHLSLHNSRHKRIASFPIRSSFAT